MTSRSSSVTPRLLSRVREALQPDWVHSIAARRVAAGLLVVLAAFAAVRADPSGERRMTVVAAHDLSPGAALGEDDLKLENRLAATLPDGAVRDLATVVGATVAGPVARGEILTDVRLLGSRLAEATSGVNARIVPLHLHDTAVLDVLRSGDVVDVIAAPDGDASTKGRVLATDGIVVLVSAKSGMQLGSRDRVVLVAVPVASAAAVAGASLLDAVTVVLH